MKTNVAVTGYQHVKQIFENSGGRAMFMPYFAVGYPDYKTSIDIMEGMAKNGADVIEVGVPFSDPIADGPVIQEATQISLRNGTSLPDCINAIRELRQRGVTIPLMLMGYVNPVLAYGIEAYVRDAVEAGASGFIVPDLPPDEAAEFQAMVEKYDAALAYMLAPTSDEKRIKLVAEKARGFIYLVSVTGVTGAREGVPTDLEAFIKRVRQYARQPLVVGFGIGSPEKAQKVGRIAEGVIVGSKLITLAKEGQEAVLNFVREVRQGLGE